MAISSCHMRVTLCSLLYARVERCQVLAVDHPVAVSVRIVRVGMGDIELIPVGPAIAIGVSQQVARAQKPFLPREYAITVPVLHVDEVERVTSLELDFLEVEILL